ncbi:MAG: 4Fe-4S dicluster domain-containing protein [Campylobacterota bacterium]
MNNDRRDFVKIGAGALFFGTLLGGGAYLAPKLNASIPYLRPPGALDEKDFLATCIKCGQCVQVCPYHSLELLDITKGNSVGTPHLDARERGCYLCDLLPCVLACPSGSLNHDVMEASQVQMGMAILKRPDRCLAMLGQNVKEEDLSEILTHSNLNEREAKVLEDLKGYIGKPCTICADLCPYPTKEKAIGMVQDTKGNRHPEVRSECVGCGVCEELCPTKGEAAIVIIPRAKYSEVYG